MKRTPLYAEHVKLGAKIVEFGGWEMPLNYSPGILAEHLATRKFGGIFDISHMGRFRVSGRDALPFLQCVLTSNAGALEAGQSQYALLPDETGGAIDDVYLYRIDEREYLLVVNATNIEKDWDWLQQCRHRFPELLLEDHTDTVSMLSLQGPGTKAVLQAVMDDTRQIPEPMRNNLAVAAIFGTRVPITRTGYTGEPIGFELFPPAEMAGRLWNELLAAGERAGIVPVGLGARDTLRIEAGYPLYGHELGNDIEGKEIPIFALPTARFAVSFSEIKGEFTGRRTLMRQAEEVRLREEGQLDTPAEQLLVPRVIMPLAIPGGSIARPGCPVFVGEKQVGNVTSGTMIPYWKTVDTGINTKPGTEPGKRAICLAYLDADLKETQRTRVIIRDKVSEAIIVERHSASEAAPYARPLLTKE
ncbi:glycine cleavage system aminomethyltransferase GcvT [Chloroflexota bacterium]